MSNESPFKNERRRANTFKNWPHADISVDFLAKEGFYYTHQEDKIRCAYCNLELSNLQNIVDIHQRHIDSRPICPFLNRTEVDSAPRARLQVDRAPIRPAKLPKVPKYATLDKRLGSFKKWPPSIKLKPSQLAEAGLFYTGKSDNTVCFFCGNGLNDWKEDDLPWEEHARWYPDCEFVIFHKGRDFVNNVRNGSPTENRENKGENGAENDIEDTERASPNSAKPICKVCLRNELKVLFLPCRHLAVCVDCAFACPQCPICRSPIEDRMNVFL